MSTKPLNTPAPEARESGWYWFKAREDGSWQIGAYIVKDDPLAARTAQAVGANGYRKFTWLTICGSFHTDPPVVGPRVITPDEYESMANASKRRSGE